MNGLVIELWHLLLGGATAFAILSLPFLRIRKLLQERNETRQKEKEAAVKEARYWDEIVRRISALENWRESHVESCSNEHKEIRDQIITSTEKLAKKIDDFAYQSNKGREILHQRITKIETMQGELRGTLSLLVQERHHGGN